MSRTNIHRVAIQFGDCDPAGIVFFPNFLRWMDQSSLAFFMSCGIPPWRELVKTRGIVGTPLLEIHTKFVKSATYGETIEVHTTVEEWKAKAFTQRHVSMRGDTFTPTRRSGQRLLQAIASRTAMLRTRSVRSRIRPACSATAAKSGARRAS